jgi:hypothetical protein
VFRTCSITVPINERGNVIKVVTNLVESTRSNRLRSALKRLGSTISSKGNYAARAGVLLIEFSCTTLIGDVPAIQV